MKIGIIGNMNNNAVNLARFLSDRGENCTVLFFTNEAQHFIPSADGFSNDLLQSKQLSWGGYRQYFTVDPRRVEQDLAGFDYLIGSRLSPAYLRRCGRKLDMFMPTGGDIHSLPFFNTFSPKDLTKWAIFSRIQRQSIREVGSLYWDDTNPEVESRIQPFTSHLDRIREAIPCLYYPDYEGANLERRKGESKWYGKFAHLRLDSDFVLFHHVKHVWRPGTIRHYGKFHEKGNDQVVWALKKYYDDDPKARIKIVMFEYGDDYVATRRLADQLGVAKYIHWFPQMGRKDLMLGIEQSDAVIGEIANSWYSYGTIIEGMAMGKAVIHNRNDTLYLGKSLYPMLRVFDAESLARVFKAIERGHCDLVGLGQSGKSWLTDIGVGNAINTIVSRVRSNGR